ncbi:hypothetical protein O181_111721 [Austropuccinia psidii MF-1]|uniref:Cx9C motif-containing protein 4, mitochondrial n=1 Tax=Austropuccinia psidii MF-1 TaxID=1389203 RepID=A0A9Q3K1M1_9BASI|nr:hypothetical protein [Austropuccinia psidii MF-1]
MPVNQNPPCQFEACQLQSCLNQHLYKPENCDKLLSSLYRCCSQMYQLEEQSEPNRDEDNFSQGFAPRRGSEGGNSGSTACPMKKIVDLKLSQLEK